MGMRIRLDESYKPIAGVMDNPPDADLAPVLAMAVVMLQDNNRLSLALAGVFDIAGVEITIVTIVSANGTKAFLFGQQLSPKVFPFARGHKIPLLSAPRSQFTSTPSASASALSS